MGVHRRLRLLQGVLPALEAERDRLVAHFTTWRATQITTRTETYQRCFIFDILRAAHTRLEGEEFTFSGSAHDSVREAWDKLGVGVIIEPRNEDQEHPGAGRERDPRRTPRRVRLSVYEKDAAGKAVLVEERPHDVMDAACPVAAIKLRKSLWAKRSVKVGFSDLGALKTFDSVTDSAAAAAADTLGALPAAVSGGLEQATKIQTNLDTLRECQL